jgi:hypothetical protein
MRVPAAAGVKVMLTVQVVATLYVRAMHVPTAVFAKSIFAAPRVSTPTLPTVVPAAMEKLKLRAALVEPMATVPKFWLDELPL